MEEKTLVVTAALPYANGDIHLGHLVEYIQADIWVRFQRMNGRRCLYFCADDTHGTPVMISARKEKTTPEALIDKHRKNHLQDFADFFIEFDHYSSTHSPVNRDLCHEFFKSMREKNHIEVRDIEQAYCEKDRIFLPDRFIRGTCPSCGALDQYGDSCEVCSNTYLPAELKEPRCALCGHPPVIRESTHLFFQLSHFLDFLKSWVPKHTSIEVSRKLAEWLKGDLRDWNITRDAPYFGFEVPGYPEKYFYVWMDAPLGYIAATKEWCKKNRENFDALWKSPQTEIYHFIGKDIIYFHTLFWPAMLETAGYSQPRQVFVHGFLTVNGEKMSKSKGTFINARTYLKHLGPEYLRYYLACKMSPLIEDVDLNFDDFRARINAELVGKITNLGSRGAQLLNRRLEGKLGELSSQGQAMIELFQSQADKLFELYQNRETGKAMVEIRNLADQANRFFDAAEPWKLIQQNEEETRRVLSTVLHAFRILAIYLKPILPEYVKKVEQLFGEPPYRWDSVRETLKAGSKINAFERLMERLEASSMDRIVEESRETREDASSEPKSSEAVGEEVDYATFSRIDLRVGKIISAKKVERSKKLLALEVDLGYARRKIFAGIKQAYNPEELVGRQVAVVANLKPKKMKFGVSEGMVLAAGEKENELFLIAPDDGAREGQRIL